MNDRRGPWYLLTGFLIGLVVGVLYAWLLNPVQYVDSTPGSLRAEAKAAYRSLIALSYQGNADAGRARSRLALLQDDDLRQAVADQAKAAQADGTAPREAQALATLAALVQTPVAGSAPQMAAAAGTQQPETNGQPAATFDAARAVQTATPLPPATLTATATITPRPSATGLPTLGPPFKLLTRQNLCDPNAQPGLLQVQVIDGSGAPVAGVRISITWQGGNDSFSTGLKPEIGPGNADYQMGADVVYSLRAGEGSEVVSDLKAETCSRGDGSTYLGGYLLRFSRP